MLRQYFEMKSRHPDAILFYRMGDFYEMFFDDAKDAAPLLGIALTARHRDSDIEAPMCGVPHQAIEHHVAKLVAAGRKVAICDQVEDPRAARGLVRRDITRVVTPGTVLDPESLVPSAPSYLAALVPGPAEWGSRSWIFRPGGFERERCRRRASKTPWRSSGPGKSSSRRKLPYRRSRPPCRAAEPRGGPPRGREPAPR